MGVPGQREKGDQRAENNDQAKSGAKLRNDRQIKLLILFGNLFGIHPRIDFLPISESHRHDHLAVEHWLVEQVRPSGLRAVIADERKTDRRPCIFDGLVRVFLSFVPISWRNAQEREMIEVKDEIFYLVTLGFLVSKGI